MGEILGIVVVFTVLSVVENVQIILSSYGINIDLFYGIIAGLVTGFGITLFSLISRSLPALSWVVGGRGGVGEAKVSVKKFLGGLRDIRKRSDEIKNTIERVVNEYKTIKEVSLEEIRKINIEIIRNLHEELEEFLNKIYKALRPYIYYGRFQWLHTIRLSFIEEDVLRKVMSLKNEAIGILRSIERAYSDIVNGFKKILDGFLDIDRKFVEVNGNVEDIVKDLEKDLGDLYGLVDGIRRFEERFVKFDENALRTLEEKEEGELAKEKVDIGTLKRAEEEIRSLLKTCKTIGEEARKIESIDEQVIEKIKRVSSNILRHVEEKRIYSIINEQFKRLIETKNVKGIIEGRIAEIENTKDPAAFVYYFGKGVDSALESLANEMDEFIRGLESEETEIQLVFRGIRKEINTAKEGLKDIHKIGDSLKEIRRLLKNEKIRIGKIESLLKRIEERDVKRLEKELRKVEKAVTAEEQVRFKTLQERYRILEGYFKHMLEMFNKAQKAITTLEKDIEEVENLSRKLSDPFKKIERELATIEKETFDLLEGLRKAIENHKNSLYLLRNRILYRIREVCATLLGIKRHLEEETARRGVARAS